MLRPLRIAGLHVIAVAIACSAFARAQASVVIPPGHDHAEGNGVAHWALAPFASHRQLIIDGSILTAIAGQRIGSLAVRRNVGGTIGATAGRLRLTIKLSRATRTAAEVSARFADNRGPRPTVAFHGEIALPATDPSTTPSWTSSGALTFSLQRPFPYAGGPLCIETITTPLATRNASPSSWWPIDAAISTQSGTARVFGQSCIRGFGSSPAGAQARSLLTGATARFYVHTDLQSSPPVFTLGKSDRDFAGLPLPFEMAPIGAPGCYVLSDSLIALGAPRNPTGLSSLAMQVPSNPAVAGVTVFGQWFQIDTAANPLHLTSSNSVAATFASSAGLWPIAWIESDSPSAARGTVLRGRVPVLRIAAQ